MENQGKSNPFIFFSPGGILSEKDRDINSDLVEIHNFFAPIDNLFGDYESRKKFGLERKLFRRLYSKINDKEIINNEGIKSIIKFEKNDKNIKRLSEDIHNSIEPAEWKNFFKLDKNQITNSKIGNYDILEENTIIITRNDLINNPNKLLVIYLIYENEVKDLVIDFDFIDSIKLREEYETFFHNKIRTIEDKNDKISQIFVIDTIRLKDMIKMCESRFDKRIEDLGFSKDQKEEILKALVDIKSKLFDRIQNNDQIYRITDTNVYELYPIDTINEGKLLKEFKKEDNIKLFLADQFCSRKVKMKSIEKFNFIRIRIGWENNRYVLFLHPYESETNYPVKYPPKA